MPIPLTCPHCQAKSRAPDEDAGQTVRCPQCTKRMRVPGDPPTAETPPPRASRRGRRYEDEDDRDERPRRRFEDEEDDDPEYEDDDRTERGRRGFRCPYCGTSRAPRSVSRIAPVGWVVFAVLMLTGCGILLCWVGLLITEEKRICRDCGMTLT